MKRLLGLLGQSGAAAVASPSYWLDAAYDSRLPIAATNPAATTLHDHLVTVAVPVGVTIDANSLRVVETSTLGTIDRPDGSRYKAAGGSVNRIRFLPASLSGSTLVVKAFGRWLAGETRTFHAYWNAAGGIAALTAPTHLGTSTSGSYKRFERLGPETDQAPYAGAAASTRNIGIATTTASLQANLASLVGVSPTGENTALRWLYYRANGNGTTYGLVAESSTETVTGPTIGVTGTVTGSTRSVTPDWTGAFTATYEHKIVTGKKSDLTGADTMLKQVDVLHVHLVYTCQQAYTPINDAGAGTSTLFQTILQLVHSGVFTSNVTTDATEKLTTWYATAASGPTAWSANADTAALAVAGSIMGGAGSSMCVAVRVNSVAFAGFTGQPNIAAKWYGANLQFISTTNTATIPVGATITVDFDVAHHGTNSATTVGDNLVPSEMVALMRQITATPTVATAAVERYAAGSLAATMAGSSADAVAGSQWFIDNALANAGLAANHAYAYDIAGAAASLPDDDDGAYGHAHYLHGLCLRYLRTGDAALVAKIETAVQWQIDIEQAAVSAYGSWWSGSAPYWYAPNASVSKTADGGISGAVDPDPGDGRYVDPTFGSYPNHGTVNYATGQVRRQTSIDQLHMKAHGLFAYLYLLRNAPAITANTTLQANARSLVARMKTFEAFPNRFTGASLVCGNLDKIVNGLAPTFANGITATELNHAAGTPLANPYDGTDWAAWQVSDGASTVINPSSNIAVDDFFRSLFATGSSVAGVTRYLQGRTKDMLASDIGRHDVGGTATWTEYTGAGVVSQAYPKGWMPQANATGNNYVYSAGRSGDKHSVSLTSGGSRDAMLGRAAQRMIVLCLAALLDPTYVVPVELSGGVTVLRSVALTTALDDLALTLALYGTEATTKGRKFTATGMMGASQPKVVDAVFNGYWLMAAELWFLVKSGASYATYYPIGSW